MAETMMEALGRYSRENVALTDALAAEQAAHDATRATLATRTQQLATRTAQRDALAADKAELIALRDDWRDKALAWKALADLPARTADDNGMPDIWRLMRHLQRLRDERDTALVERDTALPQRDDAVRERDQARAERDALAPEYQRAELVARMNNLAQLLDERCDLPRGHSG